MRFRRRSSKRVFGLSLTEVSFLLVFFLLLLLSTAISQDTDLAAARRPLADLLRFQKQVQEVLDSLGVSLGELRKVASRLIAADLVEKSKRTLVGFIDLLIDENKRLRHRVARLDKKIAELMKRAKSAEEKPGRLGKSVGEGGTEPGSCWFAANGRVEFFLDVVIYDQGLHLQSVWPESRRSDLQSMGIEPSTIPSGGIGNPEFANFAEPIYFKTVDRRCRLFARLIDRTTNKEAYKRQCKLVERYFFIHEVER